MAATQFFLGANTPTGFYSLYDELIDRSTARSVYILKGGPGCGKSSFLRYVGRCAEEAGLRTQSILCSGDPNSLDGLILPELHTVLVDGTAPHVVEPFCPGAVGRYVDLGRHYDCTALQESRNAILFRTAENQEAYRRCYRCLAAAALVEADNRELLFTAEATARLKKRAKGLLAREIKKGGDRPGTVTRRFLSAITCTGPLTLWDTVTTLCSRIYELCDSYGFAHELLVLLRDSAAARGHDVIACPSPMCPERLEHLLIPTLGLAFVSSSREQPFPGTPYRRIHTDAILTTSETYGSNRARVRFAQKISRSLREEALSALAAAKAAHDELEQLYNPHVNFSAVYRDAEELVRVLLPQRVTANP